MARIDDGAQSGSSAASSIFGGMLAPAAAGPRPCEAAESVLGTLEGLASGVLECWSIVLVPPSLLLTVCEWASGDALVLLALSLPAECTECWDVVRGETRPFCLC